MKVQYAYGLNKAFIKPFEIDVNENQPLKELVDRVVYYMDGENFVLTSFKDPEVILYQSFGHNFINQNTKIGNICKLKEGVVIYPIIQNSSFFRITKDTPDAAAFSQLMVQRSYEDLRTITIWNSSETSFTLDYTFELRQSEQQIKTQENSINQSMVLTTDADSNCGIMQDHHGVPRKEGKNKDLTKGCNLKVNHLAPNSYLIYRIQITFFFELFFF